MGLFSKLFKGNEKPEGQLPKGFVELEVASIRKLTADAVEVGFAVGNELAEKFNFLPGQYLTLEAVINGEAVRRSYSICSGPDESLSVGIKLVEKGAFSTYANTQLTIGDRLAVMPPQGNFTLKGGEKQIVAFAAGSGITPILAIAKSLNADQQMHLFFGNKSPESTLFAKELMSLSTVNVTHIYSQDNSLGTPTRLTKEKISALVKENLEVLKADCFLLCGPEEMITAAKEVLTMFGVSADKIRFELFTAPTTTVQHSDNGTAFKGSSKVEVLLDGERFSLTLKSDGKTILDAVNDQGYDAPYSCRGGVCCTCKAKVIEGKATMKLNYSLTDQEVADGYILTCQARPSSETLKISYYV